MSTAYSALVLKELLGVVNRIIDKSPDTTNMGKMLAEMYVWDEIAKLAKKNSDGYWNAAEKNGIYNASDLDPGTHTLVDSKGFALIATVTQPVKRFNQEQLARLLKASKYKVPEPITKQFCNASKMPTKSNVILAISERV